MSDDSRNRAIVSMYVLWRFVAVNVAGQNGGTGFRGYRRLLGN